MTFRKIQHPYNMAFADRADGEALQIGSHRFPYCVETLAAGVQRLVITGRWDEQHSQADLRPESTPEPSASAGFAADGTFFWKDEAGQDILPAAVSASFGVCGESWMLQFQPDTSYRFYGLGEKQGPLEKSGIRTKFWNTDVFADFPSSEIEALRCDPYYASIPYLIVRTARHWAGLLINNPYPVFVAANDRIGSIANQKDIETRTRFYVGSEDGLPEIVLLHADSPAELTRRFQRLVGTTALPPLWALGHHQCRWGYKEPADLLDLKEKFAQYRIPNSGLWLDIDYMDGYRVFTWHPDFYADPARELAALQADGQKVVPIIDPGVKNEKGYPVAESGLAAKAFCLTPEGKPYIGFVWPGDTLFPDFACPAARAWWAEQVRAFAAVGLEGAWLDMNDPSVGPVELWPMRFDQGRLPHAAYHNQYADGMARATREGFLAAQPGKRPFLLTRSAFIGTQNYSAVWNGDNLSTDAHLQGSISTTLNLALSGIPFNGPDVGGFGRDTDEDLILRWYRAGFLFPFFRNHCAIGKRDQEPWQFSHHAREEIAHVIRLRYKLLPYLYQLWIEHEETGEAVLRPLFYEFPDDAQDLSRVGDQFMVGPSILQAPGLKRGERNRNVLLPQGAWYDPAQGVWLEGGTTVTCALNQNLPLYLRSGSLLPMQVGLPTDHHVCLDDIEIHAFLRDGERASLRYRADDGETFGYQRGERSEILCTVERCGNRIRAELKSVCQGWKPLRVRLVLPREIEALDWDGPPSLHPITWRFTGTSACNVLSTDPLIVKEA